MARRMSFKAAATGLRSFQDAKSRLWRGRWTTQVSHAGLGKRGMGGSGEALEALRHGGEESFGARILELAHDPQPELGALAPLKPQPKDLLAAVGALLRPQPMRLSPA